MAGFALSSLIGLINRMLYSGVFGTGVSLDAFLSANKVPDILFNLMAGGALASAFIPMFATFLTQNDRVGAWRLASNIGILLVLSLGLAAALVWLAAPGDRSIRCAADCQLSHLLLLRLLNPQSAPASC